MDVVVARLGGPEEEAWAKYDKDVQDIRNDRQTKLANEGTYQTHQSTIARIERENPMPTPPTFPRPTPQPIDAHTLWANYDKALEKWRDREWRYKNRQLDNELHGEDYDYTFDEPQPTPPEVDRPSNSMIP